MASKEIQPLKLEQEFRNRVQLDPEQDYIINETFGIGLLPQNIGRRAKKIILCAPVSFNFRRSRKPYEDIEKRTGNEIRALSLNVRDVDPVIAGEEFLISLSGRAVLISSQSEIPVRSVKKEL